VDDIDRGASTGGNRAGNGGGETKRKPRTFRLCRKYTVCGDVVVKFAHVYRNVFAYSRSQDPTMESDEARWESSRQSNRLERMIATVASSSTRSVAISERSE
jgi:hypothetical protein